MNYELKCPKCGAEREWTRPGDWRSGPGRCACGSRVWDVLKTPDWGTPPFLLPRRRRPYQPGKRKYFGNYGYHIEDYRR